MKQKEASCFIPCMRRGSVLLLLLFVGLFSGCATSPPEGITPISPFDVHRYAGTWYEIARLDHVFERGLTDVTATYSLSPDGSLKVINRGYDPEARAWRQAEGKACFNGDTRTGSLKVSFFGPFYGGYHIVGLDQDQYLWSLVMGPDRDSFWILSRTRTLPDMTRSRLLQKATQMGIDISRLQWVSHTRSDR